jgi:F-type H+-transporting ATPase subunit delta
MSIYALRYARALAEIVSDEKAEPKFDPRAIDRELGDFAGAWEESRELREVFFDPSIAATTKVAILDRLASRLELSKTVRNFLAVLSNHERMEGFPEVLTEYRAEMRRRLGIAQVEFTTARPLDEAERQVVVERIGVLAGAEVEATFYQDASLLGGALLRIGSTVYDGSVRARLEQLKEKLATS